jgi:dolichol-phosphate hexosyltransferase
VRTGFQQAKADFVFMLDADYTYPGNHIPEMLDLLLQGCDVVIGSRLKGSRAKGSISRMNIIGNHLLTSMAAVLYFHRISDLCTGYWGFRGEVLSQLRLSAGGFELEADLFTQVVKKGYRLGEVPIYYRRRGTPTKLNSIRSGFRIAWKLLANRFR